MDLSEYEAVIEQHVRTAFGLGPDDPLPPPGPVAIATELVRERERSFVEEVERRRRTHQEMWVAALRLARDECEEQEQEQPTIAWGNPAAR